MPTKIAFQSESICIHSEIRISFEAPFRLLPSFHVHFPLLTLTSFVHGSCATRSPQSLAIRMGRTLSPYVIFVLITIVTNCSFPSLFPTVYPHMQVVHHPESSWVHESGFVQVRLTAPHCQIHCQQFSGLLFLSLFSSSFCSSSVCFLRYCTKLGAQQGVGSKLKALSVK